MRIVVFATLLVGLSASVLAQEQESYFSADPIWYSLRTAGDINHRSTRAMAAGDVDGDGDLDLVTGSYDQYNGAAGRVALFLNDGWEQNSLAAWSSTDSRSSWAVSLGDVDGDGDLDLVCGKPSMENTLYTNEDGLFTREPTWTSSDSLYTRGVALGDVDGDGDLDLVCANSIFGRNTIHWNDGKMLERAPGWVSDDRTSTSSVALGDVDGDGDLDVVFGNEVRPNTLHRNVGGVLETTWSWSSHDSTATTSVALGDIDGDGRLDLVSGNKLERNALYPNLGGTFSPTATWRSAALDSTAAVALGDVDGDGDLDLVCGNGGAPNTLYLNRSAALDTVPSWSSGLALPTMAVVLADLFGDGDLDLACANRIEANTIYLNVKKPLARAQGWMSDLTHDTHAVAVGDLDADGKLDLVFGNYDQQSTIHRSTANLPETGSWWSLAPANTRSVALGDVEPDGDVDVVFGNENQPNTLYKNQDGVISLWWSAQESHPTRGIALGDIDGDGDLDLVCANFDQPNALYESTDAGIDAVHWPVEVQTTTSVALGDVDLDGDLDLVCGNGASRQGAPAGRNAVYLNDSGSLGSDADGDGMLDPAWLSSDSQLNNTECVALGDVDGDGYPELACGNGNMHLAEENALYKNEGGSLTETTVWHPETDYTVSMDFGDVDRDGDLDLICGTTTNGCKLYLNDEGNLSAEPHWQSEWGGVVPMGVVLADVDSDGDLDLVCGNGDPAHWQNAPNTISLGTNLPPFTGDPVGPTHHRPNNSAYLRSVDVDRSDDAKYRVEFVAFDVESDSVWVEAFYQHLGDLTTWAPIEIEGIAGRIGPLPASPEGAGKAFDWDLSSVPFDPRPVVLRLDTTSIPRRVSSIQHGAVAYYFDVGFILRPELQIPSDPVLPWYSANGTRVGTVTVGDTVTAHIELSNNGNGALWVQDFAFPTADSMWVDRTFSFEIRPGRSDTPVVWLAPRRGLPASGAITIVTNDGISPRSIPVEIDVLALRVSTGLLNPADEIDLGEEVVVIVTPDPPEVRVEGGFLYYGPNDGTQPVPADSVPLFPAGTSAFVAVIPEEAVTEASLRYYVRYWNSDIVAFDPPDLNGDCAPDSVFTQAVRDPERLTAFHISDWGFRAGYPLRIEVSLPQGATFEDGTLHFRRGGEETFRTEPLSVEAGPPSATIPDSLVGPRGLEYWVEVSTRGGTHLTDPAIDPSASPRRIPITVDHLEEAAIHPGSRYRMVSIPLDFGDTFAGTLESLLSDQAAFGPYDPVQWRSFRYVPIERRYAELSETAQIAEHYVRPGRGFWLISKDDHRIDTKPVVGTSTRTDSAFTIELRPGWNQIGNPFMFSVAWSSMLVDGRTMTEAVADTLVEPPIAWAGDGYADARIEVLEPFAGYFLRNNTTSPVVLSIPPRATQEDEGRGMSGGAPESLPVEEGGWAIRVQASTVGAQDRASFLGVATDAADGRDRHDRFEPPISPGHAIALYFPHETWPRHGGHYDVDMRPAADSAGHVWSFDVAKSFVAEPPADEVVLEFGGVEAVTCDHEHLEIVFVDRELGETLDLRERKRYRFHMGERGFVSEDDARFALLVGTADFVDSGGSALTAPPQRTVLYPSRPNPTGPAALVRYDLARAGDVDLRVYDVRGTLVRVLQSGYQEAGRHEVRWDGRDLRGARVASGVYFYSMRADGVVEARRLVLMH